MIVIWRERRRRQRRRRTAFSYTSRDASPRGAMRLPGLGPGRRHCDGCARRRCSSPARRPAGLPLRREAPPPHICISPTGAGASRRLCGGRGPAHHSHRGPPGGATGAEWLDTGRRQRQFPNMLDQSNEVQTTGGSSKCAFLLAGRRRGEMKAFVTVGAAQSREARLLFSSPCGSWRSSRLACSASPSRRGPLLVDLGPSRLPFRSSFALVAPARPAFRDVSH